MSKFFTVFAHTFLTKFKSKSFIITTVIIMLVAFGISNIETIIDTVSSDEDKVVYVKDESEETFSTIEANIQDQFDTYEFKMTDEKIDIIEDKIKNGEAEIAIHLTDAEPFPEVIFYTESGAETYFETTVEQQLNQMKSVIQAEEVGIDEETLASIYEPVEVDHVLLAEDAKTEEELDQARGIVYIMLFILYFAVIIYGQMIATEVAQEKSSRVMEILISSASPVTHMFAKIFAIACLGLAQMGIIVGGSYFIIKQTMGEIPKELFEEFGLNQSASLYVYAIVFFLLGYLLYATIAAMLGSIVSRVEDVQQLVFPMMMLIIIAFMIAMFGLSMPDAKFITITSFIPFFTPMIMFLRVGMLHVPFWEIALSIIILLITIGILASFGARIYRGGVLLYGGSRSLKDFKEAFTMSRKEK